MITRNPWEKYIIRFKIDDLPDDNKDFRESSLTPHRFLKYKKWNIKVKSGKNTNFFLFHDEKMGNRVF